MEKEIKSTGKRPIIRILSFIILLLLAMVLLGLIGYRYAKNSASQENSHDANRQTEYVPSTQSPEPSHMPAAAQTIVPEDDSPYTSALSGNDFLVIAHNDAVSLYTLTAGGEQIFTSLLPISLTSLLPEDRARLEEGMILDSETELASLLEDLSS